MSFNDAGHGYDVFGFHPPTLERSLRLLRPVYERYFAVTARGIDNIPASGPALVIPNHAGVIPLDGLLLGMNIGLETARFARVVADHFVPLLPGLGTFFSRIGAVGGSRGNLAHLLDAGELVVIFPEGVTGPAKDPADGYHLQSWRVGHVEFAIRHRALLIPTAIIGSEEAWPLWKKLPLRMFGSPYLPIPRTLWPRRVPISIHYGEPIALYEGVSPDDADDPAVLEAGALRTRAAVEALIERGLAERAAAAEPKR